MWHGVCMRRTLFVLFFCSWLLGCCYEALIYLLGQPDSVLSPGATRQRCSNLGVQSKNRPSWTLDRGAPESDFQKLRSHLPALEVSLNDATGNYSTKNQWLKGLKLQNPKHSAHLSLGNGSSKTFSCRSSDLTRLCHRLDMKRGPLKWKDWFLIASVTLPGDCSTDSTDRGYSKPACSYGMNAYAKTHTRTNSIEIYVFFLHQPLQSKWSLYGPVIALGLLSDTFRTHTHTNTHN